MRWLRHRWPAFVWAGVIWTFSTGWFSSDHTSSLILPVLHWLLPHASSKTLWMLHGLIRKAGHVFEYFVFSLLILRAVRGERRGLRWSWALLAVLLAASYAATDELHQSFVPDRSASYHDVLLDGSSAAAAQILAGMWWAWRGRRSETLAQKATGPR